MENFFYAGAIVNTYVKDVKEILIDNKNDTAIVNFTFGFKPLEPIYSLVCIDGGCPFYGGAINKTMEGKIKLKKYDKGWRVEK